MHPHGLTMMRWSFHNNNCRFVFLHSHRATMIDEWSFNSSVTRFIHQLKCQWAPKFNHVVNFSRRSWWLHFFSHSHFIFTFILFWSWSSWSSKYIFLKGFSLTQLKLPLYLGFQCLCTLTKIWRVVSTIYVFLDVIFWDWNYPRIVEIVLLIFFFFQ